jgi:hypothetical protein
VDVGPTFGKATVELATRAMAPSTPDLKGTVEMPEVEREELRLGQLDARDQSTDRPD